MNYKEYQAQEEARLAICIRHLEAGVNFVDIRTACIDEAVVIGAGTLIGPCVTLEGKTVIGENCRILQNSRIVDSVIGDGAEIQSSVVTDSQVGQRTKVGPFAYLRPGSRIGSDCKVGDFVEVKNSSFGDGSKASHRLRRNEQAPDDRRGRRFYRLQYQSGFSGKGGGRRLYRCWQHGDGRRTGRRAVHRQGTAEKHQGMGR